MTTGLVFLAILLSAVLVHELAHFGAARSIGVPVRAFSVGFGPILFKRVWAGTEWRVSLIPLGGYVDLPGLSSRVDDDGVLHPAEGGMAEKRFGGKAWVLLAGVLANFVLGTLLLTTAVVMEPGFRALTTGETPDVSGTQIVAVSEGSLAAEVGLQAGDVVLRVAGVEEPIPEQVVEAIRGAEGTLFLVVDRGGAELPFEVPWPPADLADGEVPVLGVQLTPLEVASVPPLTALVESTRFAVLAVPEMVSGFVRGFASALTGQRNEEVAGPVGIVGLVNDATQVGVASVLVLAAIINFSLAVFNLLPIPGLDGGRVLLAGVVALRGRPFRPGQEEAFHMAGILAVLALIVLITLQEVQGILSSG